jgi:hypothetical protein
MRVRVELAVAHRELEHGAQRRQDVARGLQRDGRLLVFLAHREHLRADHRRREVAHPRLVEPRVEVALADALVGEPGRGRQARDLHELAQLVAHELAALDESEAPRVLALGEVVGVVELPRRSR